MAAITWQNVYAEHTDLYDEMIAGEDFEGNLLPALNQIHPLDQKEIVEFGAGTGRLTTQLVGRAHAVHAFDLTSAMLVRAHQKLKTLNKSNWTLGVADSRNMPLPQAKADVAVEGWSVAQVMTWNSNNWQAAVEAVLNEMVRVVRPGGVILLIETLGTGEKTPQAPDRFVPLYEYFEKDRHASRKWIRTDIRYPSRSVAQRTVGELFGEAIVDRGWETTEGFVLPECTGIWWFRR